MYVTHPALHFIFRDLQLDLRLKEQTWRERGTADPIEGSFQEQFLFGNAPPQPGGSLRARAVGLLVCSLFQPRARGPGLRHKVQFSKINIPDSLSGQGLGAGAKTELGSILDCVMVGGPELLAPGP